MKNLVLKTLIAVLTCLSIPGIAFSSPALTQDASDLMTYSGLTVESYGGYLNGESFQQEGILTYNGYQYTAFWNTNRAVVMARRALPDGGWQKFEFTDYHNTTDDAHNTISLGVCPNDGTLHIAFDHHGDNLHYRKSQQGFMTDPANANWSSGSFSAVTGTLTSGTVTAVTYPRFVTTPQGNMLFEYRYGTSGSGDQYLYEYNGNSHSWTSLGKYIDGISYSINAYPHGLAYGKNSSRLHVAWCWRETSNASTNHDLLYIYSDDNGRTWKNNNGSTVGTTGSSFVNKNSSGIKVWTINQNRGLINQEHMAVDNNGRVHVLLSHLPDSEPDDSDFTSARTKSLYFHYFRDQSGTWSRNSLAIAVIKNFRGKLAVSSSDNLYAILPDLRIASASSSSNWIDWSLVDSSDSGRFFSDPLIDTFRLQTEDNKLTILYPEKNSSNIHFLDYTLDATAPGCGGGSYGDGVPIRIVMRGTTGEERVRVRVGDNQIGDFTLCTEMAEYKCSTGSYSGKLYVEFYNDGSGRDVQVDYVSVNGDWRQAEDMADNTGVWVNGSCGGSYSEWLACNGRIDFGDVGVSCTPTSITAYLQVEGGSWQQTSSATVASGDEVIFGPQPASGGSWSWTGCGTSGSSREQTIYPASSCTATATYTSDCGAQSSQDFNLTVSGGSATHDFILRARSTDGQGHVNLIVDNQVVAGWTLGTSMSNYSVNNVNIQGDIEVEFDNDDATNRDVQIDYLSVDNASRQAEDQGTNTGVWQDDSCGGSYSEWLHCNGVIEFGTTP